MPSSAWAIGSYSLVTTSMGEIVFAGTGVRGCSFSRSFCLELTLGLLRLDPLFWLEGDYFFDYEFFLLSPFI